MNPARLAAVRSLISIRKSRRYANLELDAALKKENLSSKDASLFTALVYGTLEHEITLDFLISRFCTRKPKDLSPFLRTTLQTAFYQLHYLDSIPARAVLFESAEIAKTVEKQGGANLTSAVLRAYLRAVENKEDLFKDLFGERRMSVIYSIPEWIVSLWCNAYGMQQTEEICKNLQTPPKTTLHVNLLKTTREALAELLTSHGLSVTPHTTISCLLTLDAGCGDLRNIPGYDDGLFFVQDQSSTRAIQALGASPSERIADVCSAPGGKTFAAAIQMQNKGAIFASDLHENRTALIQKGAERLGITIINASARDARKTPDEWVETMDRVLCDVPCSGLGVLAKKPDIRHKSADEIKSLPQIQSEILDAACTLVRPGGTLVYSTCTLNPMENDAVVESFLERNQTFTLKSPATTLFPTPDGGDGFFYAVMEKQRL